jgi:hypothetical protein
MSAGSCVIISLLTSTYDLMSSEGVRYWRPLTMSLTEAPALAKDRSDVLPRLARLVSEIGRDGAVLVEAGSSGDDDLVVALTRGHPDRVGVPADLWENPAS